MSGQESMNAPDAAARTRRDEQPATGPVAAGATSTRTLTPAVAAPTGTPPPPAPGPATTSTPPVPAPTGTPTPPAAPGIAPAPRNGTEPRPVPSVRTVPAGGSTATGDQGGRYSLRVAVASDRQVVRATLGRHLGELPGMEVIGATTLTHLRALCLQQGPQVALVETPLLSRSVVTTLEAVRREAPCTHLVVSYRDLEPEALDAAIGAGIVALIPASRGLPALLQAIRHAARPRPEEQLVDQRLTRSELALVALLGSGQRVADIAQLLNVSTHTVEKRKRRIYTKLGVDHQSHAVSRASGMGTANPAGPAGTAPDLEQPILVDGTHGPDFDLVVATLAAEGAPVLLAPSADARRARHCPVRDVATPQSVVLVDPEPEHWRTAAVHAEAAVVVLSRPPLLAGVVDALLRGALSVLNAQDVPACLSAVVSLAVRGFVVLDGPLVHELLACAAPALTASGGDPAGRIGTEPCPLTGRPELTAREHDILRSIAAGHSVRQTARALGIATKTVENTQTRLFQKLGARNRAQALAVASRFGLLPSPGPMP